MTLTNTSYFKQMFHIHVKMQSQILNNNLDCIYHLRSLVFLFILVLFCNGVMVYLGCLKWSVLCTWGIVIVSTSSNCESSFHLVFLFLLLFLLCLLSVSIPILLLPIRIFCFQVWGGLCTDGALWSTPTPFF